jgi:NAD(P)-dependent dehydrogenase (short-subunit alcohol dehydrogenase family)
MLEGKVAVVTGAGHGIGRGHALELAAQGASVVVNDLGSSVDGVGSGRDADQVVDLIRERGGTAIPNYDDVADYDGAARMVAQAVDAFGRLDILVNNAGIVRDSMIFNMAEDAWDAVIRVHLKGTYAPTHHAAQYWRARSKAGERVAGRVINTTSGAGLSGNAQTMPGGAVAKEPDEFDEFDPLDPSLSSPIVAWLASDEADHVTGQVLRAIGETLILMKGWRYGPTVRNGRQRWDAETVGAVIATDIFESRAPGLRPE